MASDRKLLLSDAGKILLGTNGQLADKNCCCGPPPTCPLIHLRVAEMIGNASVWGWAQFTDPGDACPTIYQERQIDITQNASLGDEECSDECSSSWGWRETAGPYPFTENSGFYTTAPYVPPISDLIDLVTNCPNATPFGPQTVISEVYGSSDHTFSCNPEADCHKTLSGPGGLNDCFMSWDPAPHFRCGCDVGSDCEDTIEDDNYNHSCTGDEGQTSSVNVALSNPFDGDINAMAVDEVNAVTASWDNTFPAEDEGGGALLPGSWPGPCYAVQAERLKYKFTLDAPAERAFTLHWAEQFHSYDPDTDMYSVGGFTSKSFFFDIGATESPVYTINPPATYGVIRVEHDPSVCSGIFPPEGEPQTPPPFPDCCWRSGHE